MAYGKIGAGGRRGGGINYRPRENSKNNTLPHTKLSTVNNAQSIN